MARQDRIGRGEPDADVVKSRPIATVRSQDAVVVPAMGVGALCHAQRRNTLAQRVRRGAVAPTSAGVVDELAIERTHLVAYEDQVGRARELRGEHERGDDRL